MKFLSILFMALTLWSSSKGLASSTDNAFLYPLDKTEKILDSIKIKDQKPLRDIDENFNNFSELIKTFDEFKVYDVDFIKALLTKVKANDTLSGEELFVLRHALTVYYKINKKILDFAKIYDFSEFKMSETFAVENHNIPLIKAHLIWLTAHMLVLDHLEVMHNLLYENEGVFRRIVKNALLNKAPNKSFYRKDKNTDKTLDELIKMNEYIVDIGENSNFSQQINLIIGIEKDLKAILSKENGPAILIDAIVGNPTAKAMARGKVKFNISNFTFIDSLLNAIDSITGVLSEIFGNIAGSIHWRKGSLYKNKTAQELAILSLKPMDILIEKSPFVLTDKFIPGHYGHVAIYLGTKKQLMAIGMWDHPDILPYQKEIDAGKVILEAVRAGVRLTSLEDFMNIDELTIMTKSDALSNPGLLIEEITRGMDQIGKDYDFNFDVSTLDKIVCSELIYITFGNVHWPTQYRFGRPTITPDNVAEILFQKNTKFKIKNFMVSNKDRQIKQADMSYIADELDYELRSREGDPISNQQDPTNSYWKKESKCYNVSINDEKDDENSKENLELKRTCKMGYREFYYEESDAL